jgi:hypothetical protein
MNRRITVSKIDLKIPETALRAYFENFGEIESILFLSEKSEVATSKTA